MNIATLRAIADDTYPNARSLAARRWEEGFNLSISALLAGGLIVQAPRRRTAYALTPAGRKALEAVS